jgi:hypothetical protein
MADTEGSPLKAQIANKLFFGISLFILGLALGLLASRPDSIVHSPAAMAQVMRPATTGGIMAFTGQIDKNTYGIMMIDVDAGTLWVYQYREKNNQLKLLAARNWLFDRYLEEYNSGRPTPSEIAQLISTQQQKGQSGTTTAPAPEANEPDEGR